jgi:glycosyltransferase involved in cell wall biosynthesis
MQNREFDIAKFCKFRAGLTIFNEMALSLQTVRRSDGVPVGRANTLFFAVPARFGFIDVILIYSLAAQQETPMRVLAFNNYDIGSIASQWEAEGRDAPSQHLWGCPELEDLGHSVSYLPFDGSSVFKALSRGTRFLGDLDLQRRVLAQANAFDVIYCAHQPTVAGLALLRALGLLRKPVVAVGYQSPRALGLVSQVWSKLFVQGLDRLLCMSDEMLRDFERLGMDAAKLGQIRWGVDLSHYGIGPAGSEPHFVSVGKSFRDFDSLVRGFPFDRARLTILGAGRDLDLPDAPADRLTIRGDWIDWREFAQILPGFDGMVLPIAMDRSRGNNAIGLTAVTEALASGVPVVATHNPYIGIDLEAEGVGRWVAPGDPQGWRDAVGSVLDAPDPAGMRTSARALAEDRINITAFAATLDQALRDAVAT